VTLSTLAPGERAEGASATYVHTPNLGLKHHDSTGVLADALHFRARACARVCAGAQHTRNLVRRFEDRAGEFTVTTKMLGELFDRPRAHSVFDVVAWRGNYVPYKFDLAKFVTVNSVSVDHLDPSIFTVLTIPSSEPGVASVDFVIFPPRWMCAEHTFRPPYYHRNCMSEFMGLIDGGYDAKVGFVPGGSSLHGIGVPHGPDAATFEAASCADTSKPVKFTAGTAFMFETRCHLRLTAFAADESEAGLLDTAYAECWKGLRRATIPVRE